MVPGMQSLSQTHPVEYMQSFCPLKGIVEVLNVVGMYEVGFEDEIDGNRDGLGNRDGIEIRCEGIFVGKRGVLKDGITVGAVDGAIVGNVEEYTDGFNDSVTVGVAVKRDGAIFGKVEVYTDGYNEGVTEDGIKVEIIVGLDTILSRVEQFCCSTQNLFWQVAKGLQHCELEVHPHCA